MRENDGSAFALVDIGHSPALDFQELLSSERLCASGHCFSPLEHFGISLMSLICNNTPVGPESTAPLRVRLTARQWVGMLGGVLYEEAVPGLAVFLVWPDLTGLEAGFGEHERSRKVVPQCVANEVEFVQFIPGSGQDVPGERSPWRGTLLNDDTIGILDPYSVWSEVPG